jgi:isocitrate dehydrogenase kinase/phosphatase
MKRIEYYIIYDNETKRYLTSINFGDISKTRWQGNEKSEDFWYTNFQENSLFKSIKNLSKAQNFLNLKNISIHKMICKENDTQRDWVCIEKN